MMKRSSASSGDSQQRSPVARIRVVLGFVGLVFAFVAIFETRDQLEGRSAISPLTLGGIVVLSVFATGMAATAWATVVSRTDRNVHRRHFLFSLVGKYVPGGVFQAAGLISLTADSGLGLARAASSYVVFTAISVVAGMISCLGVAAMPDFTLGVRLAALLAAMAGLAAAASSGMSRVASWLGRLMKKPVILEAVPIRTETFSAMAWIVIGLTSLGSGFALVLTSIAQDVGFLASVAAFVVSWLIGFVAVPFPAGLGVREGVLAALLAPQVGVAATIWASLGIRLAVIVGEIALLGFAQFRSRVDR